MSKETDNSLCFGLGLLAGVIGGIIGGILFAPKSGEETRAELMEKANKIKENLPEKVETAKKKGLSSIEQTKASIENIIEDIQGSLKAKKMALAKEKESQSLKQQN